MQRPRIGIPLTLDDRARWRKARAYHYIDRSYADAIDRAGGLPLQLPIQRDAAALVDSIDGLLIPGGDDFPPEDGGGGELDLDLVPAEQLAFDEALLDRAHARNLPIFGICYGMQLMARAGGGQLDADLPTMRPEALDHRLPPDARHRISIEGGSLLAWILGAEACNVNSLHRQAIRRVGPPHRVTATSPDNVIEAIEAANEPSGSWELGVQWHPEKMNEDSSERLFRSFVDACRDAPRAGSERTP